ncbi:topoisomerase II-associated protein PAT1 [Cyathus striatus]|nr:topoisomerase II-associated protein PAT1 [Cyathus striatus]
MHESEDLAVYTWGEESYDGLGDALQEGGDELNDETFGIGDVGKDFDFSNPVLPDDNHPSTAPSFQAYTLLEQAPRHEEQQRQPGSTKPTRATTTQSLESIWDDKSPFSVLPRYSTASRASDHHRASPTPAPAPVSAFSPFAADASPVTGRQSASQLGNQNGQRGRTLQEIEAEMLAAAQQSRATSQRQQQQELLLQQQQMQLHLQQRRREEEEELQLGMLQEPELQRRPLYEQQQQLQLHRMLYQQREQHQHQRSPPPRMLPVSQSPRFLEHQRQILLMQQQQEQQQQQRLQELQEQLRLEEVERQLAQMRMQGDQGINSYVSRRQQIAGLTPVEIQLLQQEQQRRQRSQSPSVRPPFPAPTQDDVSYLPQNIHLQQRLLSEMAQAEFVREMQGVSHADQEALRAEAMRKIVEAEMMEEKRRRKAAKIAHMSRYNDLMTQSDKDFITRIQVSQLVTQDPYADDFYAQVYGAILRSRMGLQSGDERVLKFGSGGGIGLGFTQKGGNRRPNAMQRMEQQVERIVNNARKREEEKGIHSLHSLQGALGKTSGRSYKAAPRQLLQVDSASSPASPAHAHISKSSVHVEGAKEAAKLGREALGTAGDTENLVRKEPLSHREVLTILEKLYDTVLHVEQLRRDQPLSEDEEACQIWSSEYDDLVNQIWEELRVMIPLETSDPHPFVSLLGPSKGKRILPRLTRHLSSQRMLTLLTLLVACFSQLDVVKQAPILDTIEETRERNDVERQTQAFLGSVMQSILPVVSVAGLRLVTGLLGLLLDRSNIVAVAQTRPGLALLTLFLSRVEVIKQTMTTGTDVAEMPTVEEAQQWQLMFDHLFQLLTPHLVFLFPSSRIAAANPSAHPNTIDMVDQPVWQFLAALALHAVIEQHQVLVTALREKVLSNIMSVNKGWVVSEDERQTKLANVNLFLHALGLDSSQIAL